MPLTSVHDVNSFSCGKDEIDRYLKWDALRHIQNNMGMTHVAVDKTEVSVVHGFYSCRVSELSVAQKPSGMKKLKGESMPIIAVTHFGTRQAVQRRRIGERMLFDMYRRVQMLSRHVGCHAVCLQALNDNVVDFYKKYSMNTYGLNSKNLWIPISTIEQFDLV